LRERIFLRKWLWANQPPVANAGTDAWRDRSFQVFASTIKRDFWKVNRKLALDNMLFSYYPKGITIEQFLISHKIERVIEILVHDELNLTAISYLMHYGSVAHLSAQFKKMTGQTHFS
jgi:AraC-like DNA-binding protein